MGCTGLRFNSVHGRLLETLIMGSVLLLLLHVLALCWFVSSNVSIIGTV
jgi:hypothetical protein